MESSFPSLQCCHHELQLIRTWSQVRWPLQLEVRVVTMGILLILVWSSKQSWRDVKCLRLNKRSRMRHSGKKSMSWAENWRVTLIRLVVDIKIKMQNWITMKVLIGFCRRINSEESWLTFKWVKYRICMKC